MESVAEAIGGAAAKGQLPCAVAFGIAERLDVDPLRVGQEADRQGVRLSECQLGLFGFGRKAEGKHRRVVAMNRVPPDLSEAIRAALDTDGKLSCDDAWGIADRLGVGRQTVSDAAEGLGVRIVQCQLGAF